MDPASSANDDESEIVRRLQAIVDRTSNGSSVDSAENDFAECAEVLSHFWNESAASVPVESLDASTGDRAMDASGAARSLPRHLGRFEIRRMLGHGGFGVVLLAYDSTLAREIALKIPRPELLLVGQLRGWFLREAQAAAVLDHPGIVPVFDAGELGTIWYIAAGYVKGPSLAAWHREHAAPLNAKLAAIIVADLGEAVGHAHSRGILHRDLKPSNVLLEPSVAGTVKDFPFVPKLTDFGLSKRLETVDNQSLSGVLIGTPRYMAPEQAAGKYKEVGITTDVYGLGAILHELLTGEPPFVGESNSEIIQRIQSDELSPARLRSQRVPKDLETICVKCLEKDQSRRYQTADELADDLRRFVAGEPVTARPIGSLARLGRWSRRRPVLAALSLALALVSVLGFAGITWQWRRAEDHLVKSQQETQRAEENLAQAERTMIDLAWIFEESNLWTAADDTFRDFMREKLGEYSTLISSQHSADGQKTAPPVSATLLSLAGHKATLDGDREAADKNLEESIRIWCDLLRVQPTNRQYQRALAVTLFSYGAHLRDTDRAPGAIHGFQEAHALFDRLSLTENDDPAVRRAYADLQTELGTAMVRRGQHSRSLPVLADAAGLWRELAVRFPSDPDFVHEEASILRIASDTERRIHRPEAALATSGKAELLLAELIRRVPERLQYRIELAHLLRSKGQLTSALKQREETIKAWSDCAEAYEQVVKEEPTDVASRRALGTVLGSLGQIYVELA